MFINSSIILAPFSYDFSIIFRYVFSIDFGIDCCIDFVDCQGHKIDPWDNLLGQGASQNHRCAWLVATKARHGAVNGPSTILIDFGAICCSILVPRLVDKLSNDE